jgi:hypothetical protein
MGNKRHKKKKWKSDKPGHVRLRKQATADLDISGVELLSGRSPSDEIASTNDGPKNVSFLTLCILYSVGPKNCFC